MPAVLFAALSVEAFINEITHKLAFNKDWFGPNSTRNGMFQASDVVELLEKDRAGTITKLLVFSAFLSGLPLEKGRQPFQSVDTLFRIRNDIAHPKVRSTPRWVYPFVEGRMTLDDPESERQVQGWFVQIQTPEIAAWACQTARSVIRHIQSQLLETSANDSMRLSIEFYTHGWDMLDSDDRVDWFQGLPKSNMN